MSAKRIWAAALSIGLIGTAIGCSQATPTTPGQAVSGDRQVLSVDDPAYLGDKAAFEQVRAQLPQRISAEDAKTMLVQIDPSEVTATESDKPTYGVQQWGLWGRGFSPYWRYRSYSYLPYRNYYFPYTLRAGAYYPYTYSRFGALYNPYFYRYRGLYSPYFYRW